MKLISFSVQRFRNVLESGDIPVDAAVTCLVGKNEAGKSNLLHALDSLKSATGRKLTSLDYPRWLEKAHQQSGEFEAARPISTIFLLDDADLAAIDEQYGAGVLASRDFKVDLDYAGARWFEVTTDEEPVCRQILAAHELKSEVKSLKALQSHLGELASKTRTDDEGAETPTDDAVRAQAAQQQIKDLLGTSALNVAVCRALLERMPRFFYFDEYAELRGRTTMQPLIDALSSGNEDALSDADRTALSLLRLGFANEQLISNEYEKRSGELEAVAANLTGRVMKYWKQNPHLRLRIDVDRVTIPYNTPEGVAAERVDQYLQLRVEDIRHFFTNSLDARSSGFRWFVSFLAAFTEFEADKDVVVLLDEPALGLHARAQDDFLRYIGETLAATHQVIYTTHSPFMVDAAHLERARVVEDEGPEQGAVARTQLMSHDPDSLSPLQGALGFDIAQNIFLGPDNLVVEGLSDYTYITVVSEVLRVTGRESLNERWRILPAGSAANIPTFVALLGRHLDVTVLVDGAAGPAQRLQTLADEGLLETTRIITPVVASGTNKADIEDVFDPEDYLDLFNATFAEKVTLAGLSSRDRIVPRIEELRGKFNHNDPANHLLMNRATIVRRLRPATLDRFEVLIREINATLS